MATHAIDDWPEPEGDFSEVLERATQERLNNGPVGQEAVYIAVDASCPNCGYPERRAVLDFDDHGAVFSCRRCTYVSREREA
jgi:hypothetical protein